MTLSITGIGGAPQVISEFHLFVEPERDNVRIVLEDGSEIDDWYDTFIGADSANKACRFHREEEIRFALTRTTRDENGVYAGTGSVGNALARILHLTLWNYPQSLIKNHKAVGFSGELFRMFGVHPLSRIVEGRRNSKWNIFDDERLISIPETDWYIVDDVRRTDLLAEVYGCDNVMVYHNGLRLVNRAGVPIPMNATIVGLEEMMNSLDRPPTPDAWISYLLANSPEWQDELAILAESVTKFYSGNYNQDLRHTPGPKRLSDDSTYSSNPLHSLSISSEDSCPLSVWVRTRYDSDLRQYVVVDFGLVKKVDHGIQYKVATPSMLGLILDPELARTVRQPAENALKRQILQITERAFRTIAYREGLSTPISFKNRIGYSGSSEEVETHFSDMMWVNISSGTVIEEQVLARVRQLTWWD